MGDHVLWIMQGAREGHIDAGWPEGLPAGYPIGRAAGEELGVTDGINPNIPNAATAPFRNQANIVCVGEQEREPTVDLAQLAYATRVNPIADHLGLGVEAVHERFG